MATLMRIGQVVQMTEDHKGIYNQIEWRSCVVGNKKQPTVALSSTEAEYMALTSAAKEIQFIRNILEELGMQAIYGGIGIELFCDNKGAIMLAKNNGYSPRTKHINVRHHYIRELVERGIINIKQVDTSENLADVFTKPLGNIIHNKITDRIVVKIN